LPAVERTAGMFIGCTKLESVTLSVPHIQHANNMFENLENLTSINCDFSSLKEATKMFKGTGIKSFSGNLDSLLIAEAMFSGTGLTTFNSSLSSLEDGVNMFKKCKLDSKSVLKIVETLPKVNKECQITIGIGVDESTIEKLNQFAIDTGVYNSWSDLKLALSNKGWYCTWRNALDAQINI
jgi:hypothetical protein